MIAEIIELEKVLNQEIEAYSKLEKYIIDKKQNLITGDIEKLKSIDDEIEKITNVTGDLNIKRSQISSKFGDENLSLKQIIERINEEEKASRMTNLRIKLRNVIDNVNRHNKINAKLIEHSLKMIEYSVNSIANALLPEMSAYNNMGKRNNSYTQSRTISSIVQEA